MTDECPSTLLVGSVFLPGPQGILLVKRSPGSFNEGQWEVPGGRLKKGENFQQMMEREMFEETNLVVTVSPPFMTSKGTILTDGPYSGLLYAPVYAIGTYIRGMLKLGKEHDDYVWMSYENMLGMKNLTSHTREAALDLRNELLLRAN